MAGASDSTRNELVRAMDVRIAAIKKELSSSIARAAGDSCSIRQITDLAEFCRHFQAMSLRNSLIRCLSVRPMSQTDHDNRHSKTSSEACRQNSAPINLAQPENIFGSPTKVIQEGNHSFIENEESFNSSEEDQSREEGSRPSIQSATPRRSASPMRRVQIGKSGSHRSTALTIKSLGYFPAREKISSYRAAVGDSSEDEEPNIAEKKPDSNAARRMSVQDAISLFESKQREKKSDFPNVRKLVESSVSYANKSVLRRWSAGICEPSITCGPEGSPQSDSRSNVDGLVREQAHDDNVVEGKVDVVGPLMTNEATEPTTVEERDAAYQIVPTIEKAIVDCMTDSAEWTRQKDEELNQMLMKKMETKPNKYQSSTGTSKEDDRKDQSVEKTSNFYGHYKEKRDEKLPGENNGRKAAKDAQLKSMYGMLDQRKAEMAAKTTGTSVKRELTAQLQKARRNSLPSVNSKKETPKPVALRKASTKSASPLPATHCSWPSTRSIAPLPTKISSKPPAIGPKANRHKSQPAPAPSLTRQTPKAEKLKSQLKDTKLTKVEKEHSLKEPDQKKQLTVCKAGKSMKTKPSTVLAVNSSSGSAKPKFDKKATKKSTVVPLETRPFLRKGADLGSNSATSTKTKAVLPNESAKISETQVQVEEVLVTETAAAKMNEPDVSLVEKESERYQVEAPDNIELTCERFVNYHLATTGTYNYLDKRQEVSHDALLDEESSISPAAWVDPDLPNELTVGKVVNNLVQMAIPVDVASAPSSSLHIHHSLSQMVQAESCEPNIIEWGNAENPPSLIYQKDSPKGFKRLLKFARKGKGGH